MCQTIMVWNTGYKKYGFADSTNSVSFVDRELIIHCLRIIFSLKISHVNFYSAEDETGCLKTSVKSCPCQISTLKDKSTAVIIVDYSRDYTVVNGV